MVKDSWRFGIWVLECRPTVVMCAERDVSESGLFLSSGERVEWGAPTHLAPVC